MPCHFILDKDVALRIASGQYLPDASRVQLLRGWVCGSCCSVWPGNANNPFSSTIYLPMVTEINTVLIWTKRIRYACIKKDKTRCMCRGMLTVYRHQLARASWSLDPFPHWGDEVLIFGRGEDCQEQPALSWSCSEQGIGPDDLQRSFPASIVLQS